MVQNFVADTDRIKKLLYALFYVVALRLLFERFVMDVGVTTTGELSPLVRV